jgi:hypothetical protein
MIILAAFQAAEPSSNPNSRTNYYLVSFTSTILLLASI